MKVGQLTVAEVLRYTRHDFLNDLQLVLMNIDLGNKERARETVLRTTEKIKQQSILFSLNLPQTEIWLATLEWRHTTYLKRLSCQIEAPIITVDDEELVLSLEEIIYKVNEQVDVYSSYDVHVDIYSTVEQWKIDLRFTGTLPRLDNKEVLKETCLIEEVYEENLWKFTICER